MTDQFEITCARCEGYGRVAIVLPSPALAMLRVSFPFGEPMDLIFHRAKAELMKARSTTRSLHYKVIYQNLIAHLDTAQCPDCAGTGVSHVLEFGQPVRNGLTG